MRISTALRCITPSFMLLLAAALPGAGFAATLTWSQPATMLSSRSHFAAVPLNGAIYIMGGAGAGGALMNTVEEFNPLNNNSWTPGGGPARWGIGACARAGVEIYIFGGSDIAHPTWNPVQTVEEYSPPNTLWNSNNLPSGLGGVSAVMRSANNTVYILGGKDSAGNVVNTVRVYDALTASWLPDASNMNAGRAFFGAAEVGGRIYAVGGSNGISPLSSVEVYDPANPGFNWRNVAQLPEARSNLAVVELNDKLYAIGGTDSAGNTTNTVFEYDPAADAWSRKDSMITDRHSHAAASYNGKIYVFGGINGGATVNTIEIAEVMSSGDLLGDSINTDWIASFSAGSYLPLSYILRNDGPGSAGPTIKVTFYASQNTADISAAYRLGDYSFSQTLSAGQAVTLNTGFTLPASMPSGGYQIGAWVDPDSTITESNESNNIFWSTSRLQIVSGSDSGYSLDRAYAFPSPARISRGETIRFANLAPHTVLKILSPSGSVLKKLQADGIGNVPEWNGQTDDDQQLATGLYVVHASAGDRSVKVFKIFVQR